MGSGKNEAVSTGGYFSRRLFQPTAVSANDFPPRLSQPVLLMQCNDDGKSDSADAMAAAVIVFFVLFMLLLLLRRVGGFIRNNPYC